MVEALTFDDILLIPNASNILPSQVSLKTRLTKKISLNIPLISAAMDTVTESNTAIAMALQGGMGVIHKNLSIEKQVEEIRKVKEKAYYIIRNPKTLSPKDKLEKVFELRKKHNISSFPVLDGKKIVGIVTSRDLLFEENNTKVEDIMTKKLVTVDHEILPDEAKKIMHANRIEKLPIVDKNKNLKGMLTIFDVTSKEQHPNAIRDKNGSFIVGGAVGPQDDERIKELINAGADVIFLDTSHGHSKMVVDAIKRYKKNFDIEIVAGNIATKNAAEDLIASGADALKVGIGPGAICTTRIIAGVGVPQFSAIQNVSEIANNFDIPVIADGGIKYSGDITKALAAGASSVMLGSLLAGCEETPGKIVYMNNRKFKQYRGMGSLGAMKEGSSERYFQQKNAKHVPEGIEGVVSYKGLISETIFQLLGGLRSGMGLTGSATIFDLRTKTSFVKITSSGKTESHPHDILITEESPNYSLK
jgi:IMP dehydrogenase